MGITKQTWRKPKPSVARLHHEASQAPALVVRRRPGSPSQGLLTFAGRTMVCALGRGSTSVSKREGDGATPVGAFPLVAAFAPAGGFVPAGGRVRSAPLPFALAGPRDGWCDAAGDRNYNRPVRLPYPASHERLVRSDHLYDMVVVPDHNLSRRMRGRGSAVFMHLARPGYTPTEGCVALARRDMAWLWPRLRPGMRLVIER